MGQIYLVRHGQASLGKDNYDQLSALGIRQSVRLGEYFKESALTFEAAYVGTLVRQQETLKGLIQGFGANDLATNNQPAFNEYDSAAVIKAVHEHEIPNPSTKDGYKEFFKLLRLGLLSWMQGKTEPVGMPSFKEFAGNLELALHHIRIHHTGNVIVVSSGGPIATLISHLLGAGDIGRVEMNLRLRNTCVSELHYTPTRASVISFNLLSHLSLPTYADWITYA
jgi:broad specificity phosphatase PhoE